MADAGKKKDGEPFAASKKLMRTPPGKTAPMDTTQASVDEGVAEAGSVAAAIVPAAVSSRSGTDVADTDTDGDEEKRKLKRKRKVSPPTAGVSEMVGGTSSDRMMVAISNVEKWLNKERESKRLTVDAGRRLAESVSDLVRINAEIAKELNYLRGKEDSRSEIMGMISKEVNSAVAKALAGIQIGEGVGKVVSGGEAPIMSYARVARGSVVQEKPPPGKSNVVLVYPKDDDGGNPSCSSEETKKKVTEMISPKDDFIQVRGVRRIRKGGIAIETGNKDSADKIRNSLKLKESGFRSTEPQPIRPKVMIYDLPDVKDQEEVIFKGLYEQNPTGELELEDLHNHLRVVRKIKSNRENKAHWVVECSPGGRNWLRGRDRLYYEWETCKVKDYLDVSRCYRCQVYGHVAKFCRERTPVCSHCAGEHETKVCKATNEEPKCGACLRFGRKGTHSVNDKDCPAFVRAVEVRQKQIDYGC